MRRTVPYVSWLFTNRTTKREHIQCHVLSAGWISLARCQVSASTSPVSHTVICTKQRVYEQLCIYRSCAICESDQIYSISIRVIGKNCGWLVDDFFGRKCEFVQFMLGRYHTNTISATVDSMSIWLRELVSLRDRYLFLDGGCQLTRSVLQCIIHCVCCCAC